MSFVYKELKAFSPKDNLKVNETFSLAGVGNSSEDPIGDLLTETHDPNHAPGTAFLNFRTKAPITAGIITFPSDDSGLLLLVNHKGEVILLQSNEDKVNVLWNITIPGAFYRTPVLVGDNVFLVTKQGLMAAISLKKEGQEKSDQANIIWKRDLGLTVFSRLITTGRILIVATINGIHAYDCYVSGEGETGTFGKRLWDHRLEGIVSSPSIDGSTLFIGSEDRHFYALRYGGEGANSLWSYKTEGAIRSKACVSQKGNFVLIGSLDGFVYCFDRVNGNLIWSFPARSAVHSDIVSYVLGNDEFFLFGSDDGTFFCVNVYGKQQWSFKTNGRIRSEALVHQDTVFFGSEDNHLYGLKVHTGQLSLKYNTDGNINGRPAVIGNRLYVGSTDSFLHGIYI
ncbi:hypothetical protein LPTSP4_15080 [Leptospira ryugenii]|uniref:Pyrrolo-quinoline quinone repeat domain-containing protein n=1 Tax=Leptospira ryugenii TaxID=1917863 RepID=A0A2P2DZD7_9LEPT|nr:PQQ-binding-like beta-propeller repeat protein [Leptospira ryugenii]GBF49987.1 hypothetical protein LPTSP4_15080 [Leptospira ryugenii]